MVAKLIAFGHDTFSSLSRRNFRLYFIGQTISQTGGWMQGVAQSWLVLHLTGSATALGAVSALQFAPILLFGPYSGVLADRLPKRKLLLVTQSVLALLALVLGIAVVTDTVQTWMVFVLAGFLGIVNAVDYPTRQSFLFELTGPSEVVSAVGLTSTAANLARVVGPALAGVLIASTGLGACFLLNALSFVAVLVCLVRMRPGEFHRAVVADEVEGGIAEGFGYSLKTPVVRESLLMMAVIGTLTYEFNVTLPAFAKFSLGAGAGGLASLMSAMGLGAAIGGLVSAGRRGDGLGRLSASALLFGLCTAAVGLTKTLPAATAVMFVVGVFATRFTSLSNSLLQLRSAPAFRNRVVALWSTAFLGSTFIGAPLLGWIAEAADPRWALGAGAAGGLAAATIGLLARARNKQAAEAGALPPAHGAEQEQAA